MPGRTPPGMYVLAATLLLLVACHATPVFDLPPECTQTRMTNAAQVAFESFADAAATCWSSRTPNASADITSEGMAAHIRRGTKPQCFVEFILEGGNFVIGRRLSNNRVCEQSRHRASAIRLAINFIWVGMTTPAADGALRFWWDITAGSVINSDLYNYLQYPVLTAGRSPKDPCAFPVPHVYFFYAMVGANPGLLTQFAAIAPRYFFAFHICLDILTCVHEPSARRCITRWKWRVSLACGLSTCHGLTRHRPLSTADHATQQPTQTATLQAT